ncbi:6-phosphogluconolactonase [Litoribacillus peritrichatus]|uniref:6-phosphogluconolactonase n=1 Tax=Litoribacillus peritrichatus TaxID=718191 RepID=A0ABP7MHA8_9GAMM
MKLHEQIYQTHRELIESLTLQLADHLRGAIEHHGNISFVVSGGNTPKPLYKQLSQQHLAWDHVTICPSDERWVATDHDDSNYKMLKNTLLQNAADKASLLSLKSDQAFSDAAMSLTPAVQALSKPLNIVLLGMGDDGHIASLFPDANELEHALSAPLSEPVSTIQSESKGARVTLTLPTLLNAEHIFLLFTGNEKWHVYKKAKESPSSLSLPIGHLLHKATCPLTVCWSPDV